MSVRPCLSRAAQPRARGTPAGAGRMRGAGVLLRVGAPLLRNVRLSQPCGRLAASARAGKGKGLIPNPAQVYNTLVRDGLVRNRLADGEDGDASPARNPRRSVKPREPGGRGGRGRSRGARTGGGGRARGAGARGGPSEADGDDGSDASGTSCAQCCSGAEWWPSRLQRSQRSEARTDLDSQPSSASLVPAGATTPGAALGDEPLSANAVKHTHLHYFSGNRCGSGRQAPRPQAWTVHALPLPLVLVLASARPGQQLPFLPVLPGSRARAPGAQATPRQSLARTPTPMTRPARRSGLAVRAPCAQHCRAR